MRAHKMLHQDATDVDECLFITHVRHHLKELLENLGQTSSKRGSSL